MDRLKKGLARASIPAAFVICGLGCLLAALLLTKATLVFAKAGIAKLTDRYLDSVVYVQDIKISPLPEDGGETGGEDAPEGSYDLTLRPAIGYSPAPAFVTIDPEDAPDEARIVSVTTDGAVTVERVSGWVDADRQRLGLYAHIDEIAAVLWYTVCLAAAAVIFYRWKIRRPYRALMEAVFKISQSDLDFVVDYEGADELGRLCGAFELMRRELVRGKKRMWEAVEERKRLNSAFAHDMRTPLTVMQGHAEMISTELSGEADREVIRASVNEISKQVRRLNAFADTMGRLRRLEDYEPRLSPVSACELTEALSETARLVCPGVRMRVYSELGPAVLYTDAQALTQICENVISNASRHAKSIVAVTLRWEDDMAAVEVADDGGGFSPRDLENASQAYYRGEKRGDDAHFGLGLYISSVLAEKLGGDLALTNAPEGGAVVTVRFRPSGAA